METATNVVEEGDTAMSGPGGAPQEGLSVDGVAGVIGNLIDESTLIGRATVNGVRGVKFSVVAEDLDGVGGTDSFRIVLADGYGAGGKLVKGEIRIRSGALIGLG